MSTTDQAEKSDAGNGSDETKNDTQTATQGAMNRVFPAKVVDPKGDEGGADEKQRQPKDNQGDGQRQQQLVVVTGAQLTLLIAAGTLLATALGVLVANRMNTLVENQNTIMVVSNGIAADAARAAQASAAAAQEAIAQTKAGEATTKKVADAIVAQSAANQRTADATRNTAAALNDVAEENAKTAEATKQAVAAANVANQYAAEALNHSRTSAETQQRAYVSVVAGELVYDSRANLYVATITMENTGLTPGHKLTFQRTLTCTEAPQVITEYRNAEFGPVPPSLGPRAPFATKLVWRGFDPQMLDNGSMTMWIFGRVEYTCVFNDKFRHYTNFSFKQGDRIPGTTNRWNLIFDLSGDNSMN